MKRIQKIMLVSIMFLSIVLLNNVVKADEEYYGTVTKLSDGEATVEGTTETILTYDRLTLTWYEANPSIGRNKNGYWVGYKIEFPQSLGGNSAEASEVEKVKYQTKFSGYEWSADKSFYNNRDGQWFLTGWAEVKQDRLDENEGQFTLYEARFDWNGDGEFDQTLKLNINAENTTLDPTDVTTVTLKETGNGASDAVRTFTIQTGKSLKEGLSESEMEVFDTISKKDGFVKFYLEGKAEEEFSFEEPIEEDAITIMALFDVQTPDLEPEVTPPDDTTTGAVQEPVPAPAPAPVGALDPTPKTGVTEIIGYVVFATFVSLIGIVIIRKKNK